jgi:hypothetical protein
MKEHLGIPYSRNVTNVALAYFTNPQNLHDAATDLCLAGFSADEINTTGLVGGIEPNKKLSKLLVPASAPNEQHTWRWRLRRFLAHDRRRRGADQMVGDDRDPFAFTNPDCIRIDLSIVLAQMNVPQIVFDLLQRDTVSRRTFMLVDAKDRVAEASEIMQQNFGQLRTEFLYSA